VDNPDFSEELFDKCWKDAYKMALKYGLSEDEAESVAAATALKVWCYLRSGRKIADDGAFIATTARNLIIDVFRAKGRQEDRLTFSGHERELDAIATKQLMFSSADPERERLASEEKELALRQLKQVLRLRKIPREGRKALNLFRKGYSIQEIADQLGVSYNAAATLLHRLRRSLVRGILEIQEHAH
jgi:RNA polymerase sigma factor (sigma-70 family)